MCIVHFVRASIFFFAFRFWLDKSMNIIHVGVDPMYTEWRFNVGLRALSILAGGGSGTEQTTTKLVYARVNMFMFNVSTWCIGGSSNGERRRSPVEWMEIQCSLEYCSCEPTSSFLLLARHVCCVRTRLWVCVCGNRSRRTYPTEWAHTHYTQRLRESIILSLIKPTVIL